MLRPGLRSGVRGGITGVTVLLARVVLGERLRWIQRVGLGLAAFGVILVTI